MKQNTKKSFGVIIRQENDDDDVMVFAPNHCRKSQLKQLPAVKNWVRFLALKF